MNCKIQLIFESDEISQCKRTLIYYNDVKIPHPAEEAGFGMTG